jgi:aryl-alcohol dehydrogenase-like predicted oxidoreductase
MEIQIGGRPLFRSVQATWNLLARGSTDALSEAHSDGMGVIVKEVLANGRLTTRNNDAAFVAKRSLLEEVAAEAGVPLDALALAAVLAQPWADIVLSGAARSSHLLDNLKALSVVWNEEMDERLAGLTEPEEQYWETRSQLEWN